MEDHAYDIQKEVYEALNGEIYRKKRETEAA